MESSSLHPMAPEHLPPYITAADGSDFLLSFMAVFTITLILLLGVGYLTLHALPERIAHKSNHSQLQVVAILAVLALFTHNNLFWFAALLIASFQLPDYLGPLRSIATSLFALSGRKDASDAEAQDISADMDRQDIVPVPPSAKEEADKDKPDAASAAPSGSPA